jgi:PKD repeat protein
MKTCSGAGALGVEETCALGNAADDNKFSIASDGDVLHIAYTKVTSNNIVYRQRSAAGVWDASETTIQASTSATMIPCITVNPSSHDVYVVWVNYPSTSHIYYNKLSGGAWGGAVDWLDESAEGSILVHHCIAPAVVQNSKLMFSYKTKAASPYNVKVASLSLAVPPVAAFTANKTTAYIGQNIQFTDQSTNTPTGWEWRYNGAYMSSAQNPIMSFDTAGTYTISLNASNSAGYDLETKVAYITIYGAPSAAFTYLPASGYVNTTFTFTDTSTGQGISNWTWDFGDTTSSYAQNPTHHYHSGAVWTVNLTVTNPSGSDYYVLTINVTGWPIANFTADVVFGYDPLTVHFTDHSTGGAPTNWTWDFGDGAYAYTQSPTHIYTVAGIYTVSLTATNPGGYSELTRDDYITVILTLRFTTTPGLNITAGEYYNYFPSASYANATINMTYDTMELEHYANGTGFGGRPGVGAVHVSIFATSWNGQVAYQNYTLTVNGVGDLPVILSDDLTLQLMTLALLGLLTFIGLKYPKFFMVSGMAWLGAAIWVIKPIDDNLGLIALMTGLFFLFWGVYRYLAE